MTWRVVVTLSSGGSRTSEFDTREAAYGYAERVASDLETLTVTGYNAKTRERIAEFKGCAEVGEP